MNQNIIFKICDADRYYPKWRGVSVFGKAERLTEKEDILYGMRAIGEKLISKAKKTNRPKEEFEKIGEMMASNPEKGGPIRITIESFSGRASSR